jgi:hypothetical protein
MIHQPIAARNRGAIKQLYLDRGDYATSSACDAKIALTEVFDIDIV